MIVKLYAKNLSKDFMLEVTDMKIDFSNYLENREKSILLTTASGKEYSCTNIDFDFECGYFLDLYNGGLIELYCNVIEYMR